LVYQKNNKVNHILRIVPEFPISDAI
jgi:hypothetical protein